MLMNNFLVVFIISVKWSACKLDWEQSLSSPKFEACIGIPHYSVFQFS